MFALNSIEEPTSLIERINSLIVKLAGVAEGSQEYTDMVAQLIQLYKALELDINVKTKMLDTYGKQNEIESRIAQLELETELKQSIADRDMRVKELELELKIKESDVTVDLRKVETELKTKEIEDRRRVSPDTVAAIAANVVGILLIIGHERINVVTSKALGFIPKVFR
jgi:hypothetical protein